MRAIQASEAILRELTEEGFVVHSDVLCEREVDDLIQRIDFIAASERSVGTAWFSHGNQRIFNLINKDRAFLKLIGHPVAMEIVDGFLGSHALLSSITANIALPDNCPQPLHADQGYIVQPWIRSEVVNLVYVLDEFTNENGATRVVPKSHLAGIAPPIAEPTTKSIAAPVGALVCLDGRVWHGTGKSLPGARPRRAIFAYYCRPYIRQQENFARSVEEKLRLSLTPLQRRLLGYDIWLGLGAVNGLPVSWMDRRPRIGPIEARSRSLE